MRFEISNPRSFPGRKGLAAPAGDAGGTCYLLGSRGRERVKTVRNFDLTRRGVSIRSWRATTPWRHCSRQRALAGALCGYVYYHPLIGCTTWEPRGRGVRIPVHSGFAARKRAAIQNGHCAVLRRRTHRARIPKSDVKMEPLCSAGCISICRMQDTDVS